jgi:hypothetical protein
VDVVDDMLTVTDLLTDAAFDFVEVPERLRDGLMLAIVAAKL